ncbi:MAG: arginine--tRNA ligase [Ostreibacterium sp.]
MKSAIQTRVSDAINDLVKNHQFAPTAAAIVIHIERTKAPEHGDFACNIAMQLARVLKKSPREIATQLVEVLNQDHLFEAVEVAGPGFINFYLSQHRYSDLISCILSENTRFGTVLPTADAPQILLEFVSANPTGPLHVGHGRAAAYGATLANILRAVGQRVDCEYYVNDAGRQMDILASSVYLRYLQIAKVAFSYPKNAYQADYCRDMAEQIRQKDGDKYLAPPTFFDNLCISNYSAYLAENEKLSYQLSKYKANLTPENKKYREKIKIQQDTLNLQGEQYIDQIISRVKSYLGELGYSVFFDIALETICADIAEDLGEFGVSFDNWYSEKSLFTTGKIEAAITVLREKGYLYEKKGALWFKTTDLGDEKDRVIQRDNGAYTYFASDIAYHHDKLERGYDYLVDIFGADHHGYMARVKAALTAFGHDEERLRFELVQFAVLYKDGKKLPMSTRSGEYITLRDLRGMIGNSAARFFYIMRKPQQHIDFDLDLALSNNKDNPLYYIQYAHARIHSLLSKAKEMDLSMTAGEQMIEKLTQTHEQALLRQLEQYADVLQTSARDFAPHLLIHYLKDLATALHSYYDAGQVKFLELDELQTSRFALLRATKQVLANGLHLSGVNAPESM